MASLTRKQKQLAAEIREIAKLAHFDLDATCAGPAHTKIHMLEMLRRKIIIAEVIHIYTFVDEILSCCICQFYFNDNFIHEWRRKKFQFFNYHVIEELSLLQKLRFARSIRPRLKHFSGEIEALNALRNGLAHSFFPENLRKFKPLWKGFSIFSLDGMKRFKDDVSKLIRGLSEVT